jgi:hypothetical protein
MVQRSRLSIAINEKNVLSLAVDYPKFPPNSKLDDASIALNFAGQISSFLCFADPIAPKKYFINYLILFRLLKLYSCFTFGITTRNHFKSVTNQKTLDSEMMKKLLFFYTPIRAESNNS